MGFFFVSPGLLAPALAGRCTLWARLPQAWLKQLLMEPPLVAAVTLAAAAACAAACRRPRSFRRDGPRSTPRVEQWLTTALRLQAESTGLPIAFVQDLLQDEDREPSAVREHRDDACVVLDRPYAKALAVQLEAVWSAGVWPQPPQVLNPELVALELDDGAERVRWAAAVMSTLSGGADETNACSLLAILGSRGIASLLGQR